MKLEKDLSVSLEKLVARIKRRQITEAKDIARESTRLLCQAVVGHKNDGDQNEDRDTVDQYVSGLVKMVRYIGERLFNAQPTELILVNVVNRIIHIIYEEHNRVKQQQQQQQQQQQRRLVEGLHYPSYGFDDHAATAAGTAQLQPDPQASPDNVPREEGGTETGGGTAAEGVSSDYDLTAEVKENVTEALNEFIDEFDADYTDSCDQGMSINDDKSNAMGPFKYIHSNEVIMTCGSSKTVERFLKTAAKKRVFSVIIPEGAPFYHGHNMAKALLNLGLEVAVIPDSAILALMSQVNKVIIGTHTVMANGALIAPNGSQLVAAAAKHHSVPVVVCTELYKFSPIFPFDERSFNILVSPDSVLPYKDGDLMKNVEVINPYYDYVGPELIDVFVDQTGGHPPSYLYRLLQENYNTQSIISAGNT